MLYSFGYIPKGGKHLKSIWFVYGRILCDLQEVYEEIINNIKGSLDDDYDGNELGGASGVDSLKITTLRVRGMWVIKHPQKVFSKLVKDWGKNDFEVKALIPKSIFDNLPQKAKIYINQLENFIEAKISSISTSPERKDTILIKNPFNS